MVEKVYSFCGGKSIDRVLFDENINFTRMIFERDEGLPEHYSNSNVYMSVLHGLLTIGLDEQEPHVYGGGTLLKIPRGTKMNVKNMHEGTLELLVIKAPAPEK